MSVLLNSLNGISDKYKERIEKYKLKWKTRYRELRDLGLDPYAACAASKYKDEKYVLVVEDLKKNG